jgi:hypothetical protein
MSASGTTVAFATRSPNLPPMDETKVNAAAIAILHYLHLHPWSADTLEGIQQWWIPSDETELVVQLALERLEADRLVESVPIGGRLLWRRHA